MITINILQGPLTVPFNALPQPIVLGAVLFQTITAPYTPPNYQRMESPDLNIFMSLPQVIPILSTQDWKTIMIQPFKRLHQPSIVAAKNVITK